MALDTDAALPRFAQLTYASFDAGDGAGGWHVKESRGEITPRELRELSPHLVTSFDTHVALPEYPTPSDIAEQPRRCMHLVGRSGPIGSGNGPAELVSAGCTFHAVQAGSDSTGRPGNVFSHVVLDRRPREAEPALRPIEVWRSFELLVPYGVEPVLEARLSPGEYPSASGLVGRELVLDFLFDASTWRMGALSVLLDATLAAMRGGPRVVLLTSSTDHAALWIAAVSWCLSPGGARTLSWSVYERAARLRATFERGVHLACVPRFDAGLIDRDERGIVVLDEDEFPRLGELGAAPHRTAAGHEVAVTAWSHVAQESLVDAQTAARVLETLDRVAAEAGDWGLEPDWPLAVAHLATAADGAETSAAERRAFEAAPASGLPAWIDALVRRGAASALGTTTEEAYRAASAAPLTSPRAELATIEYLRRAFADAAWLTRPEGIPAPEPIRSDVIDDGLREAARGAFRSDDPAAVVRAVDLAARVGLLEADPAAPAENTAEVTDGASDPAASGQDEAPAGVSSAANHSASTEPTPLRDAALDALEGTVAPVLLVSGEDVVSDSAPERTRLLRSLGAIDARVVGGLVPIALGRHLDRDSSLRASDEAVEWLWSAGTPAAVAAASALASATVAGETEREAGTSGQVATSGEAATLGDADLALAIARARTAPESPGLAHAIAAALFARHGTWFGIPPELRVIAPQHLWRLDELFDLERRFPGALPYEFVLMHFAKMAPNPELTALAEAIALRDGTTEGTIAALRIAVDASNGALAGGLMPEAVARALTPATLDEAARARDAHAEYVPLDAYGPLLLAAAIEVAARDAGAVWPDPRARLVADAARVPGAATRAVALLASVARATGEEAQPGAASADPRVAVEPPGWGAPATGQSTFPWSGASSPTVESEPAPDERRVEPATVAQLLALAATVDEVDASRGFGTPPSAAEIVGPIRDERGTRAIDALLVALGAAPPDHEPHRRTDSWFRPLRSRHPKEQ